MRYYPFIVLFLIGIFYSCGVSEERDRTTDLVALEGGRYKGGIFRYNETEYLRSMYPLNLSETVGHRVVNQIYEGLVTFKQDDLSIIPAIAESWDIDEEGKVYTFYLRKDVRFHDDACFAEGKGRAVNANDFLYCMTLLCTPGAANKGFSFVVDRIKGARDYYEAAKKNVTLEQGVSGLRVIDDYTFQIELNDPFGAFMGILAMPFGSVFPKEAVEMYGAEMRIKAIGTGPFRLIRVKENDNVVLGRNPNYWGKDDYGNQLPYLDGINVKFISEEKSEMLSFKKGDFELKYRIPPEMREEVLDVNKNLKPEYQQYTLQYMPVLTVEYYGFLHKDPEEVFNNKNVRQAFNYAVDRQKITDFTLKGAAVPGFNGIVPPSFKEYPAADVKGYNYDPDKARQLMIDAGYENPGDFPMVTLQINSGGGRNEMVAEAVQKMLEENLGIKVEIQQIEFAQHYENLESGKARFWRAGWVADYPDPENFLNLLYGVHVPEKLSDNSYVNSVRYQSPEFDAVLSEALKTIDEKERNILYAKADQIAMDDAAILPLYYNIFYRLLQPYVKNFPQNSMEFRSLREVYFEPHGDKLAGN